MTIICGTDFSTVAEHACRVAALLAAQYDAPLVIVHAIAPVTVPPAPGLDRMLEDVKASADRAMADLKARLGNERLKLTTVVRAGAPADVLLGETAHAHARLVVLGSVGQREKSWLLGSTSDAVVSRSDVPVLVVRDRFPADSWLHERTPLRVTVAAELAPSTDPAVEWAAGLTQLGPCQFTLAHVSWPPEEYERLAIETPMRLDRTHPLVEEVVRRELDAAASRLRGEGETKIVVQSNMGRTGEAISLVAKDEGSDLLVVGRGRAEGREWWERSVSRAVVRNAPLSVVCIPDTTEAEALPTPQIRRVLAATDFSPLGNAAVAYALSITPDGGEVLLVHAMEESAGEDERNQSRERLERLAAGQSGRCQVQTNVLTGDDPARLISASAERFGADVICVGSRGGYGLAKALLGSVSQSVLLRSRRPVLVVQSPP
ncbi:MAG TPA: universal stress protein [Thermoanaerobaculia bacterium]|nr:universal stress protein [Thermoanaerobaculia bacterium]